MLRPIDIQSKEFEVKFKGYDKDAVDNYLDMVIKDYETLIKENETLKNRVSVLSETVDRYRLMEKTLQQSIEAAKQSAEELRNSANAQAQAIIARAQIDAAKLAGQIDDEHIKKHQEMLRVKSEVDTYKSRIKNICNGLIQSLDNMT